MGTAATRTPTDQVGPLSAAATGEAVWERVWRHKPSDAKDDALLAREERSPRWRLIVERIEATVGPIEGLRAIELGSGRGDLSALLAWQGARVTLLDQSDKALEEARQRFDRLGLAADFESGDMLADMGRWRGRFDVALSSGVIEHFVGDDRTRTLGAHLGALRPGGLAVVSVPHSRCLPYRLWKSYLQLRGWWPYGLEIPYSRRELVLRARECGFERVETECVGLWQAIGDLWGKDLFKLDVDWADRSSRLDGVMGFILLMFGRRAGDVTGSDRRV